MHGELGHSSHVVSNISKEVNKDFSASAIEVPRFDQIDNLTPRIGAGELMS